MTAADGSIDWQAVETGLRQWVIDMTGTAEHLVAWDREPIGYRDYNQIDLRLYDQRARQGMAAEILYPEPGDPAAPIQPIAVSQRACTWSITVTTRDQHAAKKAYVVLDELAVMLELPYSQQVFTELGLAIIGPAQVIASSNPASEHRDLSQAMLRVELGYVQAVTAPDATLPASGTDIIEHVETSGTVINVDQPIDIPLHMQPPLPPPPPPPGAAQ